MNGFIASVQSRTAKNYAPVALVVVAAGLVSLATANSPADILTSQYIAVDALLALSLGVAYGLGGLMSLAQGAICSVGAYATAIAAIHWELPGLVGLVLALAVPFVFAYALSWLLVSMPPLALAFATLTLGQLITVIWNDGGSFTGSYNGLAGIPPMWPNADPRVVAFLSWVVVAGVLLVSLNLRRSARGLALHTLKQDRVLAVSSGIGVRRPLSTLFAFSGAVAGLAGWMYAHVSLFIAPDSLGVTLSISAVVFVVVGGERSLTGGIVAALALTLIQDHLPSANANGLFYGIVLIVMLVGAPDGLGDLLKSVLSRVIPQVGERRPDAGSPAGEPGDRGSAESPEIGRTTIAEAAPVGEVGEGR